jgi:hypothetical protein
MVPGCPGPPGFKAQAQELAEEQKEKKWEIGATNVAIDKVGISGSQVDLAPPTFCTPAESDGERGLFEIASCCKCTRGLILQQNNLYSQ